jgi:alkylhydroperoxidase family enzyme
MNEDDFEKLRKQGLSDEDIWDVAWFTAFFNLSNRMMIFLAVKPDEEFYSMGK